MTDSAIFSSFKTNIQQVLPNAEVTLFGSRARGTATEESDWDLLVLTTQPVTREIKNKIHDSLFPFSAQLAAFINTFIVEKTNWATNPRYYLLQQTISGDIAYL